ncbi:hypothetical protein [Burkholderia gladioli]|nr:hypothetical protein [Burkholderia gladioli]
MVLASWSALIRPSAKIPKGGVLNSRCLAWSGAAGRSGKPREVGRGRASEFPIDSIHFGTFFLKSHDRDRIGAPHPIKRFPDLDQFILLSAEHRNFRNFPVMYFYLATQKSMV